MRLAVVSDLHANRYAWQSVLRDLSSMGADRVISLGDAVGYGPHPAEVLESLHQHAHDFVLGNHDAALAGLMSDASFSDEARAILAWTRDRVNASALEVMRGWPLVLRGPGFRCAHGAHDHPGRFPYIFEPEEAPESWAATDAPLLWVGHTHLPSLFVLGASGTPRRVAARDFQLEPGKRYIVNPGSVGQPRDGDARASYVLYDTDGPSVFFRRVPFDLEAYARDVEAAGLPPAARWFLDFDPLRDRRPVREQVNFHPPAAGQGARGAVAEAEVGRWKTAARRWKILAFSAAALGLSVAAAAGFFAWRSARREAVIEPPWMPALHARDRAEGVNLLTPPAPTGMENASITGWRIRLSDRSRQKVSAVSSDFGPAFRILSPSGEVAVESLPVRVDPGADMTVEVWARVASGSSDSVLLEVMAEDDRGRAIKTVARKSPSQSRREGWRSARETFAVPAGAASLRVRLVVRTAGMTEIEQVGLSRAASKSGRGVPARPTGKTP